MKARCEGQDLTEDHVLPVLSTRWLGRNYRYYDVIASTQDEVLRQLQQGQEVGLVVAAGEQRAGRGQRGNVWHTFSQTALSFSFGLSSRCLLRWGEQPLPYHLAGVVARTLSACTGCLPEVVFPNDVLIAGKKVAGILVEVRGSWVIVGIGINVNTPKEAFPPYLRSQATSLSLATGQPHSRLALLVRLLSDVEKEIAIDSAEGRDDG